MTKDEFNQIVSFSKACAKDAAHDAEHTMRVLYLALDIARFEQNADIDVLIAACLLHDIGRADEKSDPSADHAVIGAGRAYRYLTENGWPDGKARHAAACIRAHRYRKGQRHESVESRILFDADKLDVAGAIGVARTLQYGGAHGEALYTLSQEGAVEDGTGEYLPSFMHEYMFKLRRVGEKLHTARAKELYKSRESAARDYYEELLKEARDIHENGRMLLHSRLINL